MKKKKKDGPKHENIFKKFVVLIWNKPIGLEPGVVVFSYERKTDNFHSLHLFLLQFFLTGNSTVNCPSKLYLFLPVLSGPD